MKNKQEKRENIILAIVLLVMVALFFGYAIHKENNKREYAENHNCSWMAQGGLTVCK